MAERAFMKLRLNGILHKSLPSVCLYVHPSTVARQQIGKKMLPQQQIHATIEEICVCCFLCSPCNIKESRRLILPRASFSFMIVSAAVTLIDIILALE
jgi:hypothetical protein